MCDHWGFFVFCGWCYIIFSSFQDIFQKTLSCSLTFRIYFKINLCQKLHAENYRMRSWNGSPMKIIYYISLSMPLYNNKYNFGPYLIRCIINLRLWFMVLVEDTGIIPVNNISLNYSLYFHFTETFRISIEGNIG